MSIEGLVIALIIVNVGVLYQIALLKRMVEKLNAKGEGDEYSTFVIRAKGGES